MAGVQACVMGLTLHNCLFSGIQKEQSRKTRFRDSAAGALLDNRLRCPTSVAQRRLLKSDRKVIVITKPDYPDILAACASWRRRPPESHCPPEWDRYQRGSSRRQSHPRRKCGRGCQEVEIRSRRVANHRGCFSQLHPSLTSRPPEFLQQQRKVLPRKVGAASGYSSTTSSAFIPRCPNPQTCEQAKRNVPALSGVNSTVVVSPSLSCCSTSKAGSLNPWS